MGEIGGGGTRHAAGLGLAERSDALCLVVSEERGEVSVAWRGHLERVSDSRELGERLDRFLRRTARKRREPWLKSRLTSARHHWREGILAAALASGLWLHTVPGARVDRSSKAIPIVVENLPEGYRVAGIEPPEIDVVFEGRRRDLALAQSKSFQVRVDGDLVEQGRRTFSIEKGQVEHPPELRVVGLEPGKQTDAVTANTTAKTTADAKVTAAETKLAAAEAQTGEGRDAAITAAKAEVDTARGDAATAATNLANAKAAKEAAEAALKAAKEALEAAKLALKAAQDAVEAAKKAETDAKAAALAAHEAAEAARIAAETAETAAQNAETALVQQTTAGGDTTQTGANGGTTQTGERQPRPATQPRSIRPPKSQRRLPQPRRTPS